MDSRNLVKVLNGDKIVCIGYASMLAELCKRIDIPCIVQLAVDGIDEKELVVYDIIALMDENYKDTYGDVSVEIQFGTTYDTEKAMVVLAGFEIEEAREQPYMDWYVLRTEAIRTTPDQTLTDMVRIGLKQLNLPWMEEEPMMLVVISQELEPRK